LLSVLLLTGVPTNLAATLAEVFFVVRLFVLTSALLSGLLILRVASRRLLAEILATAKIITLALATAHIPVEIVVLHSVLCHLCIPPMNG
jgi:hypothetical protein